MPAVEIPIEGARVVSMLAFLGYGLACLFSDHMADEFERFGLARMRRLTGALEVLGALGLGAGYVLPVIGVAAAAGLALLMLLGVATRVRVGDSLADSLPALVLFALNGMLVYDGYLGS